jgi:hypothetical protein
MTCVSENAAPIDVENDVSLCTFETVADCFYDATASTGITVTNPAQAERDDVRTPVRQLTNSTPSTSACDARASPLTSWRGPQYRYDSVSVSHLQKNI